MRWPQITMVVLLTASMTIHILRHGELQPYNAPYAAIDLAVVLWLLIAGGYFR